MDILLQCVNINTPSMLYKELRAMINGHHFLLLLRDCGNFTQRCYIYTGVYAKVINLSLRCVFLFEYSQTSLIRPHWSLDNFGRIRKSRINQKCLYIGLNRRRFVPNHFWADYHLGGSKRCGLGGSDCTFLDKSYLVEKWTDPSRQLVSQRQIKWQLPGYMLVVTTCLHKRHTDGVRPVQSLADNKGSD